jgi:hypothetical protein
MPFIRGRYHINPIMGEALEAAREAATLALEHQSSDAHDQADGFASSHLTAHASPGPIHRIEIEAAEMVPAHSGCAERGFVARVHRHPAEPHNATSVGARHAVPVRLDGERVADSWHNANHAPAPETHVFTDHRDLVNFLQDELANDAARG